ncbi:kila-n domain protein : Uncharacterized protein OS=Parabacteroides goldsteinii dnLKV18 GN=C803_01585 PE=4 SV=1: KilA-N [Tuwongella immobilis]|uniref:KilA-N domain-containing protein n=1 Tax=Tuwongella immobilis TaxID=692036 RepID=A0A6C2YLN0_9BACT|nr:kila-n domain protein : Uncharacterized protein OS=Parabacteroides goldsteinii dnLKV18 GN=C803_01585 PE=4 SV=1: KilA-N [Tuwongella immobilis]VTS00504.1 kila-n domain protein : Uncharacterized protein OS=Parabacteroides goldsteinii dnLKV18 GN=C803_01585 PE=4 SV=1: KilA-N [Tuwongella immobilis]
MQQRNDGYINATQLCKAAGKLFADYRRSAETKAFLDALGSDMGIPISAETTELQICRSVLIEAKKGGAGPQGTWVHPRVAIDLARWCSPQFAVVVNGWIFELMNRGSVAQPSTSMPGASAKIPVLKKGRRAAIENNSDDHYDIMEHLLSTGRNPTARQLYLIKQLTDILLRVCGYQPRTDGRVEYKYSAPAALALIYAVWIDHMLEADADHYFGLDD